MQEAPAQQVGARQHLAGPTRPASQATPQASRRPGPSLPLQRPPQRCPPQQPCSPKPLPGTMSCLHCARRTFSLAGLNSSPKLDQNFWEIFPGFSWDSWLPPTPTSAQDTCLGRRKVDRLPGAWARLVAALLLLDVGLSLAARQLHARGDPTGSPGSGAAPPSGHSHTPGVYHRGATISPAGQCREVLGKGRWGGAWLRTLPTQHRLFLLQPCAPTWAESCLPPAATWWTPEWEQLCVWQWCTLTPRG